MRNVLLLITLAAIVLLVVVKAAFVGFYRIPQNGMYPGLPAGSLVFARKRPYRAPEEVRRGEIVVFVREEGGRSYNYIWRVVGLPGDAIETAGESLVVNGRPVARERIREENGFVIYRERAGELAFEVAFNQSSQHEPPDAEVTVPPGHFFVMGDNRFDARDSRYFGAIPFSAILGKKL